MAVGARIVLDSVAPSGCRLTTFEVRVPKWLLAEVNTHRALSKNAASSRAKPLKRVLEEVSEDPYVPADWRRNQKGMQGFESLSGQGAGLARSVWLQARDQAVDAALKLGAEDWWWHPEHGFFEHRACINPDIMGADCVRLRVHKQTVNRLLEPFMWADVVLSGTDWQNFFHLRCHPTAQPEFQEAARQMHDLFWSHRPTPVLTNGWHIPYLLPEEESLLLDLRLACGVARCSRVSYSNHGTGQIDREKDLEQYQRLLTPAPEDPDSPVHASPFEHCAQALEIPFRSGNFRGWEQHRYQLPRHTVPEPVWSFEHPGYTEEEVRSGGRRAGGALASVRSGVGR